MGRLGWLSSLTVNDPMGPASRIYLDGGSVSTLGNQTYAGTVVLGADTTLTSSGGLVDFASTIDGAHNLTVSATSGAITFGGDVGTGTALASLTAEGQTISVGNSRRRQYLPAGERYDVRGHHLRQRHDPQLGLSHNLAPGGLAPELCTDDDRRRHVRIRGLHAGHGCRTRRQHLLARRPEHQRDQHPHRRRHGAGQPVVRSPGPGRNGQFHRVTSAYNVGSANLQFDTISTGPATGWVRLEGPITAGSFTDNAAGTTTFDLGGSVTTTMGAPTLEPGFNSGQTYEGPVVLDVDTTLTSADNVIFASTVDGGTYSLSLGHSLSPGAVGLTISSPDTLFSGDVGGNVALGSLSVSGLAVGFGSGVTVTTTSAGGETGNQTYSSAVGLEGSGATFDTDTGTIKLDSTIDGAAPLSVTATSGTVTFDGYVGSHAALSSLDVTAQTIDLNAGDNGGATPTVSTTGGQTYNGAVVLAQDATLTDTGTNGIDFVSTIDGAQNLVVNATSGAITFGGSVGDGTNLNSLTAEGSTIDVGADVMVTNQLFLQARGAGGITFQGGTIDPSAQDVSLQADALTFVGATVIDTPNFEYAPYTQGGAVTLGAGQGALGSANLTLEASNIAIGAVTIPGTGFTTTAAPSPLPATTTSARPVSLCSRRRQAAARAPSTSTAQSKPARLMSKPPGPSRSTTAASPTSRRRTGRPTAVRLRWIPT